MKDFNPTDKQILGGIGLMLFYISIYIFTVPMMMVFWLSGLFLGFRSMTENALGHKSQDIRIINTIAIFVLFSAILLMPIGVVFTVVVLWGGWKFFDYLFDTMVGTR